MKLGGRVLKKSYKVLQRAGARHSAARPSVSWSAARLATLQIKSWPGFRNNITNLNSTEARTTAFL